MWGGLYVHTYIVHLNKGGWGGQMRLCLWYCRARNNQSSRLCLNQPTNKIITFDFPSFLLSLPDWHRTITSRAVQGCRMVFVLINIVFTVHLLRSIRVGRINVRLKLALGFAKRKPQITLNQSRISMPNDSCNCRSFDYTEINRIRRDCLNQRK